MVKSISAPCTYIMKQYEDESSIVKSWAYVGNWLLIHYWQLGRR